MQAPYPELRGLFVGQLGVQGSLSGRECLAALRSLRDRAGDAADQARLAARAYAQLASCASEAAEDFREAAHGLEDEGLLLAPRREGGGAWAARWCAPRDCMWYDAPGGVEVKRASLEAHYPPALRPFFVSLPGAAGVDPEEVSARLALVGDADLAAAYGEIDRVQQDLGGLGEADERELLRGAVRASLRVPRGAGPVQAERCVFLPAADAGLAALLDRTDLGGPYPGLRGLFVDFVGMQGEPSTADLLAALRKLQAKDAVEGSTGLLAASAYQLLLAGPAARTEELRWAFEDEALLFVPAGADGPGRWCRSSACMWHDAPAGVEDGLPSLAPHYPASLGGPFCELLGVKEQVVFVVMFLVLLYV